MQRSTVWSYPERSISEPHHAHTNFIIKERSLSLFWPVEQVECRVLTCSSEVMAITLGRDWLHWRFHHAEFQSSRIKAGHRSTDFGGVVYDQATVGLKPGSEASLT